MIKHFIVLCFLCPALLLADRVNAQQEQTDTQQSLLPDIDPQDIEIRSQFQARFPGLIRQPILGFNPRPRVFQIDPNRMPFIEDEELVVASLPVGELDRPEAPVYQPLGYASPKNGFARLGFGNYMTPEADVYAIARLGEKNWVSGNINHLSSDGHLDNLESSFRNFNARINALTVLSDRTRLRLNAGATSDFNHFPVLPAFPDENSRVSVNGFHAGANLHVAQTSMSGVRVGFGGFGNDFDIESGLTGFAGNAGEWGANGSIEYSRLGDNIQEVHRIRVTSEFGGISPVGGETGNWSVSEASAHYERLFNYKTNVKASLGVAGVTDAFDDFSFYAVPRLSINHTVFDGFDLRGGLSASPGHTNLKSIQAQNRFIDMSSQLRHQYNLMAYAETRIEPINGTRFSFGASYQNTKNYLFFSRGDLMDEAVNPDASYYNVNFENASFMKLYGSFTQDIRPEQIWLNADAYWQRPRLSGDEKIPFVESMGVKGSLSLRLGRKALLEGWGEFTGPREDAQGQELSSFLLLGSRFEYSVTEKIGVYGKIINLLDEEYQLWQGYPERGFQGFVGFTYLF